MADSRIAGLANNQTAYADFFKKVETAVGDTGQGQTDGDGHITASELYAYANSNANTQDRQTAQSILNDYLNIVAHAFYVDGATFGEPVGGYLTISAKSAFNFERLGSGSTNEEAVGMADKPFLKTVDPDDSDLSIESDGAVGAFVTNGIKTLNTNAPDAAQDHLMLRNHKTLSNGDESWEVVNDITGADPYLYFSDKSADKIYRTNTRTGAREERTPVDKTWSEATDGWSKAPAVGAADNEAATTTAADLRDKTVTMSTLAGTGSQTIFDLIKTDGGAAADATTVSKTVVTKAMAKLLASYDDASAADKVTIKKQYTQMALIAQQFTGIAKQVAPTDTITAAEIKTYAGKNDDTVLT